MDAIARWIATEGGQRLADRDVIAVNGVEGCHVENARDGARTRQRDGEAHALLVAKGQHLDRERQALARCVQPVDGLDGREHAEIAVVDAGIAHGVDVRAQQQGGRVRGRGLVPAHDGADGVHVDAHAGLAHPGVHLRGGLLVLRRQIEAGHGIGLGRKPRQLPEPRHQFSPTTWCGHSRCPRQIVPGDWSLPVVSGQSLPASARKAEPAQHCARFMAPLA